MPPPIRVSAEPAAVKPPSHGGATSNGSLPQCRERSPWQWEDAEPKYLKKQSIALEQDAFEHNPTEISPSELPFESNASTVDEHLDFLRVFVRSKQLGEDAGVYATAAARAQRALLAGTVATNEPLVADFSACARLGMWLVEQGVALPKTFEQMSQAVTEVFVALLSAAGLGNHQRGAIAQGMLMTLGDDDLGGPPAVRNQVLQALEAQRDQLKLDRLGLLGLRTLMLTAASSNAPKLERHLRELTREVIRESHLLPTERSSVVGELNVKWGGQGLGGRWAFTYVRERPQPRDPTIRLSEDGHFQINVVSEGARDSSVDAVQAMLARISFSPELASFLDGWTVAIVPLGRELEGDPYAFMMGVTEAGEGSSAAPPMGLSSSSSPSVALKGQLVTANRQGAAVHEEGLLHYEWWDVDDAKKQAMREKDDKPTFWTLLHELGHAIRQRYLAVKGPGVDPHKGLFKDFFRGVEPTPTEWEAMKSGEDVLRWHFERQRKAGAFKDVPDCYLNMEAWFAELVALYLTGGYRRIREEDPAMYALFQTLLGQGAELWETSTDLLGWVTHEFERVKRGEPATMSWRQVLDWAATRDVASLWNEVDAWITSQVERLKRGEPAVMTWAEYRDLAVERRATPEELREIDAWKAVSEARPHDFGAQVTGALMGFTESVGAWFRPPEQPYKLDPVLGRRIRWPRFPGEDAS
jgi:hypothetical protein